MKQQTALEWFMYKVDECQNTDDFLDAYNEAKEMEKEQIMMAFNDGKVNTVLKKRNSEQYYNETYDQK
jgi:hypothetical protein